MAEVRMSHPENGFTHAYDTGEVNRLKGLGWVVESKQEKPETSGPVPLSQMEINTARVLKEKGLTATGTQEGNTSPALAQANEEALSRAPGPIVNERLTVSQPVTPKRSSGRPAKK